MCATTWPHLFLLSICTNPLWANSPWWTSKGLIQQTPVDVLAWVNKLIQPLARSHSVPQMPGAMEKMKSRGRLPFLATIRCIIVAVILSRGGQALVWRFQRVSLIPLTWNAPKTSHQPNHQKGTLKLSIPTKTWTTLLMRAIIRGLCSTSRNFLLFLTRRCWDCDFLKVLK